jgi:hypothetical protein
MPHERLPFAHELALAHEDVLDHALFRRLHDLQVPGRHELAFGHGHDVEPGQRRPGERRCDQAE